MPTTPTAQEQLTLELINQFRRDPHGEYARLTGPNADPGVLRAMDFFGVSRDALQAALGALSAVAPLAWNANLADAAEGHNEAMIVADQQAHVLPGEPDIVARVEAAGYTGWRALGENVYAYADNMVYGHAGFVIDWGYGPNGMQDPAGHRNALISATYTEIGIAVTAENNPATGVGPNVITHDLGTRFGYRAQFLGVVIDDRDNDDFYDIGEGLGGVTVTLAGTTGTYATTTWDAGGWQIEVPQGTYTITFSGGSLSAPIVRSATLGTVNVKIDVENGPVAIGPTEGDDTLSGTAGKDEINGLGGNDTLRGLGGNDRLNGGDGNDTLYGDDGRDLLDGARGNDAMHGGAGNDIYIVRQAGDRAIELPGGGTDLVRTFVSFTLDSDVENATAFAPGLTLTGNAVRNFLTGSSGGDTLVGMGGDDRLDGGEGDDVLIGGTGSDTLTGGAGADRFVFGPGDVTADRALADQIVDFSAAAGDRIHLADIDANALVAGDQAFTFIGAAGFRGNAGELRTAATASGSLYLMGDMNGDRVADLYIRMDGVTALSASDFFL
mgnify:CR=1 FL=1